MNTRETPAFGAPIWKTAAFSGGKTRRKKKIGSPKFGAPAYAALGGDKKNREPAAH